MKSSGSASLLACLFAFALLHHVQAGFCDGKSGSYCREKEGTTVSTYCSCKYKYKKSKYYGNKYGKRSCDNHGDRYCANGCKTGLCQSANAVCATRPLDDVVFNDGVTTYRLKDMCPAVVAFSYRTWKNRELNTDVKEGKFLASMVASNKAWSKALLLPKFYTSGAKGVANITEAWDTNCKTSDVKQAHCLAYFPKCLFDRGSSEQCLVFCAKMMNCVDSVVAACYDANPRNASKYCNEYSTFGPRGGVTDCNGLCKEYQNDYVPPGQSVEMAGGTIGGVIGVIAFIVLAGLGVGLYFVFGRKRRM